MPRLSRTWGRQGGTGGAGGEEGGARTWCESGRSQRGKTAAWEVWCLWVGCERCRPSPRTHAAQPLLSLCSPPLSPKPSHHVVSDVAGIHLRQSINKVLQARDNSSDRPAAAAPIRDPIAWSLQHVMVTFAVGALTQSPGSCHSHPIYLQALHLAPPPSPNTCQAILLPELSPALSLTSSKRQQDPPCSPAPAAAASPCPAACCSSSPSACGWAASASSDQGPGSGQWCAPHETQSALQVHDTRRHRTQRQPEWCGQFQHGSSHLLLCFSWCRQHSTCRQDPTNQASGTKLGKTQLAALALHCALCCMTDTHRPGLAARP